VNVFGAYLVPCAGRVAYIVDGVDGEGYLVGGCLGVFVVSVWGKCSVSESEITAMLVGV